ncbi:MAG: type II toxin-antitoxin system VapC family toxin [Gemmatimonadaceae bacterium]
MTVVYVESSAVLSWLLGEARQQAVIDELSNADQIVTSMLTLIECARGLARARKTGRLKPAEERAGLHLLDEASASWNVLDISDDVAERARGSFPHEPVRTLDALHLATALVFSDALGALRFLSLDDRVRENVAPLGMTPVPG